MEIGTLLKSKSVRNIMLKRIREDDEVSLMQKKRVGLKKYLLDIESLLAFVFFYYSEGSMFASKSFNF